MSNLLSNIIMAEFIGNVQPNNSAENKLDRMIIPIWCVYRELKSPSGKDGPTNEYIDWDFTVDILLMRLYPGGTSTAVLTRVRERKPGQEIPDDIPGKPWLHLSSHSSCWRSDGVATIVNLVSPMAIVPDFMDNDKWYVHKPDDAAGAELRKHISVLERGKNILFAPKQKVRSFDHNEFINHWIKQEISCRIHY